MASPNTPDQLVVPIPDTQRMLGGIGRTKVYDLVNRGHLVKVNIGSRGLITMQSIEDYVERLSRESLSAAG